MKRALAIMVALCTIGFAGFSQIAIKGSWTATMCILPAPVTLSSTLSLTYTVAGFNLTSTTGFAASGLISQQFGLTGVFGPFTITGNMWFEANVPEYMGSRLVTAFDFGGINIGLKVLHWDTDYNANFFTSTSVFPFNRPFREYPILVASPCAQTDSFGMMYILTAGIAPINVRASFVDCCTGTSLYDLYLWLDKTPLCCGIAYTAEIHFTKVGGFDYISFSGINIPLCCGISLDVTITYGVDYKDLDVEFSWDGMIDACFTVWGDAVYEGTTWLGIELWGFKLRCAIADCNYIEFINAFNVSMVNLYLPAADRFLTRCGEFELIKLGFCGAGCCGGKYDVTLRVFFGSLGGIFDITRMVFGVNIPVMANFTLSISGTMWAIPIGDCNTTGSSLCLGWTFTF
ncbi:MAG: hypothetical protein AB1543_05125 [Candidatus Bipolaricaulota bacterium]